MKNHLILPLLLLFWIPSVAQKENSFIRQGNRQYNDGKFKEAEIDYRKALERTPSSARGAFNLGNALYRQENYEDAERNFINAAGQINASDPATRAGAFHNLGNAYLKAEKYNESIQAFRQALRLNPSDDETRYNLAYAMRKLSEQQQQQQQKGDNDRKDDNKDQKDQQNSNENQEQQDQQQQQQQQKPQISKQDAERMLQALKNDEQKTLDKVNQQKAKASPVQVEKDW
jgi:tetratricopeptide (TPR) repeat protein